jgi:hypothetical protein
MNTYLIAFEYWDILGFHDDTYNIVEADNIKEAIEAVRGLLEQEPKKFHEWIVRRIYVENPDWKLNV